MSFSKKKFTSLSERQQHKKSAEALRKAYEVLCQWQDLEPPEWTPEALSNRYHDHLEKAEESVREHNLLPQVRTGDHASAAPFGPVAIYLDHIRSAHNVGSILRTVEAFRLGSVYFSDQTPTTENKQVQDTSMGTWEWVPTYTNVPLEELPRPLIALETAEGATPIHSFTFPESFTLIIGNEEYGCSERALELADHLVEIPLIGQKNSLNVANAFAIVTALAKTA